MALYLQDAHELSEGIELAKYAEAKGFEAVWQAESRLVHDAIVPMAAFAGDDHPTQGRYGRDQQLDAQHWLARRYFSDVG